MTGMGEETNSSNVSFIYKYLYKYPSGHLVPSPIFGLANAPIVETKFLELAISLLYFSPRIPLGTFSILPFKIVKIVFSLI